MVDQPSTRRWVKKRATILTTAVLVGLVVVLLYNWLAMPDVRPHIGDGVFKDHSWRFPWRTVGLPVPGYQIDFPEFDLGKEFDATYHVEQLPQIRSKVGV